MNIIEGSATNIKGGQYIIFNYLNSFAILLIMDFKTLDEKDLKIKLPFGMIVSGPSTSGKTTFMLHLLDQSNEMFIPSPTKILYAYGQYNSIIPKLQAKGIIVQEGVPSEEIIDALQKNSLIILDDLMLNLTNSFLTHLFTRKLHHKQLGCIFLTQNLFEKKLKVARDNSQYIALMNSPSAALNIRTLGSQLFPRQLDYFLSAYKSACSKRFGYLFIDLAPSSDPILRLRTNIFKDDDEKVIFIPSKEIF